MRVYVNSFTNGADDSKGDQRADCNEQDRTLHYSKGDQTADCNEQDRTLQTKEQVAQGEKQDCKDLKKLNG